MSGIRRFDRPGNSCWHVYLIECADGSLYTGIAKDVGARLAQHASGKGARYTRGRGPLVLAGKARCRGRSEALRAELGFKALTREAKVAILAAAGLARFVRIVRENISRSREAAGSSATVTPVRVASVRRKPRAATRRRRRAA